MIVTIFAAFLFQLTEISFSAIVWWLLFWQEALNVPWSSFNKRTSKLLFALRSGCQTLTNLKLFVTVGLLSSKVYAFEALCLVSLFFFICSYLDLFVLFFLLGWSSPSLSGSVEPVIIVFLLLLVLWQKLKYTGWCMTLTVGGEWSQRGYCSSCSIP
jgi:hypothetical protein